MNKHLTFSKDFWSSVYEVKYENIIVAKSERNSILSLDTSVIVNEKTFFFDVKGLVSKTVDIYENTNEPIGKIDFNFWENDAIIYHINKSPMRFTQTNYFSSEWQIYNDNETLIHFKKDWFAEKGTVEMYREDDFTLATGLFLVSFYQQRRAASAA